MVILGTKDLFPVFVGLRFSPVENITGGVKALLQPVRAEFLQPEVCWMSWHHGIFKDLWIKQTCNKCRAEHMPKACVCLNPSAFWKLSNKLFPEPLPGFILEEAIFFPLQKEV